VLPSLGDIVETANRSLRQLLGALVA